MLNLAVEHAREANHAAAVAAVFARVGQEERACWWRQLARHQRVLSRYFATIDLVHERSAA